MCAFFVYLPPQPESSTQANREAKSRLEEQKDTKTSRISNALAQQCFQKETNIRLPEHQTPSSIEDILQTELVEFIIHLCQPNPLNDFL